MEDPIFRYAVQDCNGETILHISREKAAYLIGIGRKKNVRPVILDFPRFYVQHKYQTVNGVEKDEIMEDCGMISLKMICVFYLKRSKESFTTEFTQYVPIHTAERVLESKKLKSDPFSRLVCSEIEKAIQRSRG